MMTKEQIKLEMQLRLPEYFDSYLLVGVRTNPGQRNGVVTIVISSKNKGHQQMLRAGAVGAVMSHDVEER